MWKKTILGEAIIYYLNMEICSLYSIYMYYNDLNTISPLIAR